MLKVYNRTFQKNKIAWKVMQQLRILCLFVLEVENYNDTDYYDNSSSSEFEMGDSTFSDHSFITQWPLNDSNSTEMPLDMVFNDGHRLSIIVYR